MYLAIVKQTGGKIDKYQPCDTEAEADAHVAEYGGFVVPESTGCYNMNYCTVDSVVKTLTFDSAAFETDKTMREWKQKIVETDSSMPRYLEDHITDHHDGVAGNEFIQVRYDAKIKLRGERP